MGDPTVVTDKPCERCTHAIRTAVSFTGVDRFACRLHNIGVDGNDTCSNWVVRASFRNLFKLEFNAMTANERIEVIDELLDGYCRHCGRKTETPCHCENDE